MKCTVVDVGGIRAIVCGSKRYEVRPCKTCGQPATKLCDWILERPTASLAGAIAVSKLTTCDEPICAECTTSPAPHKDLCPTHAGVWRTDPRNPQRELVLTPSAQGSATTSTS